MGALIFTKFCRSAACTAVAMVCGSVVVACSDEPATGPGQMTYFENDSAPPTAGGGDSAAAMDPTPMNMPPAQMGPPNVGPPAQPDPSPNDSPSDDGPAAVDPNQPDPTGADAGEPDAGEPDAGEPDAGEPDAGEPDAGEPDAGDTTPSLCEPAAGSMRVDATIVVAAGDTFDGQCQRYVAGPAVGDGSQAEGQKPVFRLEDGASLKNVVLGGPAADGIHTYGDVMLENITWEDIGEDALTIKAEGIVVLDGGAAYDGSDKVFQINAPSTFRVSNFRADNAGKFIRQNGGKTFHIDVYIDNCDISNMKESIFRTDSSTSTVTMTNTRYSKIGSSGNRLWYDVNPANITEDNNTQY